MSTFLGFDVLDVKQPDRSGTIDDQFVRGIEVVDNGVGPVEVVMPRAAPQVARTVQWLVRTRAEAAAQSTFLDARRGRAVPFWLPSYQQDLVLYEDLSPLQVACKFRWAGYTELVWAQSHTRRHVALYTPGFPLEYRRIGNATHVAGEAFETLSLEGGVSRAYPAGETVVMFLRFCRLDVDEWSRTWLTPAVARAELAVVEIPLEEPVA